MISISVIIDYISTTGRKLVLHCWFCIPILYISMETGNSKNQLLNH